MGEGDLDSLTFLRGLKAGGYEGPVAYEMCSPLRGGGSRANLDRCARQFLSWFERHTLGGAARPPPLE
jgi:sugar phosphate isomerase/epimerase